MTRRPPREIAWRIMVYGPAVVIAVLGAGSLRWSGWQTALVYGVAALNMWFASRQIRTSYRNGYWTGRLDLQMETVGLRARRRVGLDPGAEPWDPMPDLPELIKLREAVERMGD